MTPLCGTSKQSQLRGTRGKKVASMGQEINFRAYKSQRLGRMTVSLDASISDEGARLIGMLTRRDYFFSWISPFPLPNDE